MKRNREIAVRYSSVADIPSTNLRIRGNLGSLTGPLGYIVRRSRQLVKGNHIWPKLLLRGSICMGEDS
jgi:hypothetical protein